MSVVCYDQVCYDQVCYDQVCYEWSVTKVNHNLKICF